MATALTVIEKALRVLRVLDRNQPLQPDDRNDAMEALNSVTAWIATEYNHLWLESLCILLCKQGVPSYSMGAGATYITTQEYLKTLSLSANAVAGDFTVTVNDASQVQDADSIAIFDNNGNSFFTIVVGAPVGNVLTLQDPLLENSDSGNLVYTFFDVACRALRVRNAQFSNSITSSEIPVNRMSRDTYFDQPVKLTQGSASNWYYDPQNPVGKMYLWPTPYSDKNVFRFTAQRAFIVNETNLDEVDFPDEWIMCLAYQTACYMMDEYGLPADRQQLIKAKADELLSSCLAFDNDGDGVVIEIDRWN
jgi:hypothetical protein